MSASLVDECHRRACDARRSAEMALMPSQKTHFLELEQRWLSAASSVAPKTPPEAKAIAEPKTSNVRKRRPSKFTPDRLEQIRNLAALGKSREEIAGLLRVTVGTLQVTCSKRGISLRRPQKLDTELNLPAHEVLLQGAQHDEAAAAPRDDIDRQQGHSANLALTMHLRGRERTVPLRLPSNVITALALESQLREMSLGQLVGEIVARALADGLVDGDSQARKRHNRPPLASPQLVPSPRLMAGLSI
jgi:hypothetical protein